jgi:hypothetical protein
LHLSTPLAILHVARDMRIGKHIIKKTYIETLHMF